MSPNPGIFSLPRRQGRDLVGFHGFLTLRIFFFRHPNAADPKKIYTNLIISSETLISMHSLMGMARDPAVPALDFRGTTTNFQNSHYRTVRVPVSTEGLDFQWKIAKMTQKSRAGTAGSRSIPIKGGIENSFSDDMIGFV